MKDLILFLKSRKFRLHFMASLLVGILILWGSFLSLGNFTDHGNYISVPDLLTVNENDLGKELSAQGLRYVVLDSVYDEKSAPGVVLRQDPEPGDLVKLNRIIYVTLSSKLPPLVKMPNLVDASMRQAQSLIETYGLALGKREYKPDPCLNCVLAQMMNGKKIEPGTQIPKGTKIDLILGKGQEGDNLGTPCLSGLTKEEASDKLAEHGLRLGSVQCKDCRTSADKESARVIVQHPNCGSDAILVPGSPVDIQLSVKAEAPQHQSDGNEE